MTLYRYKNYDELRKAMQIMNNYHNRIRRVREIEKAGLIFRNTNTAELLEERLERLITNTTYPNYNAESCRMKELLSSLKKKKRNPVRGDLSDVDGSGSWGLCVRLLEDRA